MQIQGAAYIKSLTHGGDSVRVGLASDAVEVVEGEPVVLSDTANHTLRISNLGLVAKNDSHRGARGGAFYEMTVSGPGLGENGRVHVYSGKVLVTPVAAMPEHGIHAPFLAVTVSSELQHMRLGAKGDDRIDGDTIDIELEPAIGMREIVVEVRRVGHACSAPRIQLV